MGATAIGIRHEHEAGHEQHDEAGLLARARGGDVAAFEALYRLHCGRVYALCLRLTAEEATAEDCVQEAFVKAWKHLPRFAGHSRFGTWLHRIAVNEALGHLRRTRRRSAHLQLVEPPHHGVDAAAAPNPLDRAAAPPRDEDSAIDLEAAIARLPPQARKVFVLVVMSGYTHEEVARDLAIAPGTSKAQLHRARQLLMQQLER